MPEQKRLALMNRWQVAYLQAFGMQSIWVGSSPYSYQRSGNCTGLSVMAEACDGGCYNMCATYVAMSNREGWSRLNQSYR